MTEDPSTLLQALEEARASADAGLLVRSLAEVFEVAELAPSSLRYVQRTLEVDRVEGPLGLRGVGAALQAPRALREMFGVDLDGPFPALAIGEHAGVPFWLHLASGRVITLHHDASLYEEAGRAPTSSRAAFVEGLLWRGSRLTVDQLLAVQDGLVARGSDTDRDRAEVACAALRIGMQRLARECDTLPLEFLGLEPALVDEWAADLAEGSAAERRRPIPQLARALRAPAAVRSLDLRGLLRTKTLPKAILELTALAELDISDNPKLDLAAAFERLSVMPDLRVVRFDGCRLKELPESLAGLTGLEEVTLRSSAFKGPSNTFWLDQALPIVARLPRLRVLEVYHCGVRDPESLRALANVETLERLDLQPFETLMSPDLTAAVNDALAQKPRLRALTVSGLRGAPARIAQLSLTHLTLSKLEWGRSEPDLEPLRSHATLRSLALSSGSMKALPEVVRSLEALEGLAIGGRLDALPDWIGELTNLRRLVCPHLRKPVPESIGALSELEHLDLSDGKFTALPESLSKLTGLRTLRLGAPGREGWALPECVRPLRQLRELTFEGELPDWIEELDQLTALPIAKGQRTRLGARALSFPAMRVVELGAEVPSGLGAHRHVQKVSLAGYRLEQDHEEALARVAELPELRSLDLSCMQVSRLPEALADRPLEELELTMFAKTARPWPDLDALFALLAKTRLRRLALHWDAPVRLPDGIARLGALEELVLGGSGWTTLPESLGALQQLEHVRLNRTKVSAKERRKMEKLLPGCRFTVRD